MQIVIDTTLPLNETEISVLRLLVGDAVQAPEINVQVVNSPAEPEEKPAPRKRAAAKKAAAPKPDPEPEPDPEPDAEAEPEPDPEPDAEEVPEFEVLRGKAVDVATAALTEKRSDEVRAALKAAGARRVNDMTTVEALRTFLTEMGS